MKDYIAFLVVVGGMYVLYVGSMLIAQVVN